VADRPRFLAVKGFKRFQHYRDRNPVWIKLYTDVLVDPGFDGLPEAAQAQLIKIWIFRAQFGPMRNDRKFIAGKIGVRGKFYVDALIDAGFLVETDDPEPAESSEDSASKPASTADSKTGKNPLADPLANSEENAIGSVRADARSRGEKEIEGEGETTLPLQSATHRFVAAANRGLAEHPTHPQPIARITPGQGATCTAVEAITKAGVPIDFAESAIYDLAKTHKSKLVTVLTYFASAVIERWEREVETRRANGSKPSQNGARANGHGTYLERARVLLAIASQYDLLSYYGNAAEYRTRVDEAAADPRAGAGFREEIAPLKLYDGIGKQETHFAERELVKRMQAAAQAVPA
jgi:hypothetical protein